MTKLVNVKDPNRVMILSELDDVDFHAEIGDYNKIVRLTATGTNKITAEYTRIMVAIIQKKDVPKLVEALMEVM